MKKSAVTSATNSRSRRCIQNRHRPLRGQTLLFPGVLRHGKRGMSVYCPRTGNSSRLGPDSPDARQRPGGTRRSVQRRHRGGHRLKDITTGDTICAVNAPILLESMSFPDPVISIAVEPKPPPTATNFTTPSVPLRRRSHLCRQEQCGNRSDHHLRNGELHLEIIHDRLTREFKVEANTGRPEVAYREAILKASGADTKFVRQSGGRGNTAM